MPVMVSAPTNGEIVMAHCEQMKVAQSERSHQEVESAQADNPCNMDNCQCDSLNTAKVPNELLPYLVSYFGLVSFKKMDIPSLQAQFLLPNQRPPRIMPA